MALLKKASPEEIAAKEEAKRKAQAEKEAREREKRLQLARSAYWGSPAGLARTAYNEGDKVFQFSIDVINQKAYTVAMMGARTTAKASSPVAILNSVCHEGWELVNGDFVFMQTGQESRDKFLASGQNVSVSGTVMGYYLFKRCEANRRDESDEEINARLTAGI